MNKIKKLACIILAANTLLTPLHSMADRAYDFYSNEENQKLLRRAGKESGKLSKEEEEVSKKSAKHMLALSKIKDKSNQKTTDQKQEMNHDLN